MILCLFCDNDCSCSDVDISIDLQKSYFFYFEMRLSFSILRFKEKYYINYIVIARKIFFYFHHL